MSSQNKTIAKKNYGALAFMPLIVFLVLYLGFGLFFYFRGEASPFSFVPREAALIFAIACALLMGGGVFSEKVSDFMDNAANPGVLQMCFIFILAGIFSAVSRAMGGVDSVVGLGMTIVPRSFIVPGLFIISCLISISMGTSYGTLSAVAPIAVGFAEVGGYNMTMVLCAVLGGAMFGDNLSFISDTTIAATQGAGCEMKDKFRMNFKIAIPAAVFAVIMYAILGGNGTMAAGATYDFTLVKILPYLVVLALAIAGMNVIYVLGSGILLSALIGFFTGGMTFFSLCGSMASGISGMYSICLMAIVLKGIVGRVQSMGGIDWIISLANKNVKTRKGAQYFIVAFVCLIDICIGNNTICIMISTDVLKPIAKRFKIAPRRFASLLDIFACIIPGLSPIGLNVLTAMSFGGLTNPFSMMKYAFYLYALAVAALVTIQFDLLKTPEEIEGKEFYPELGE